MAATAVINDNKVGNKFNIVILLSHYTRIIIYNIIVSRY